MDESSNQSRLAKAEKKVLYVGAERFNAVTVAAIQVSYDSKQQITAPQFAQFMIDNFLDLAVQKFLHDYNDAAQTSNTK